MFCKEAERTEGCHDTGMDRQKPGSDRLCNVLLYCKSGEGILFFLFAACRCDVFQKASAFSEQFLQNDPVEFFSVASVHRQIEIIL